MGILNVTPDSFSDGGVSFSVLDAVNHALTLVAAGVDIIDIGGMSSRPNAIEISEEEELGRVIPVIKAIRELNNTIPISIDTFRAKVARLSVENGADLINDISGGTRDADMLSTMSELNVPVCLMHMRGDSNTMMRMAKYRALIPDLTKEIEAVLSNAMKSGIKRYNIILDPGLGFAKTAEQNIELLRKFSELKDRFQGFPWLVGPSRKSFIGKVCGEEVPNNRDWGTSVTCAALIEQGVDVLRVHNPSMVQSCKMADALYRIN
jgi:dihydropteroate synthase